MHSSFSYLFHVVHYIPSIDTYLSYNWNLYLMTAPTNLHSAHLHF